MSLDMNGFLENVKRAAVEAVAAGKPFGFILGKVTSVSPLKVQVDQKLELTASQLILIVSRTCLYAERPAEMRAFFILQRRTKIWDLLILSARKTA